MVAVRFLIQKIGHGLSGMDKVEWGVGQPPKRNQFRKQHIAETRFIRPD
jgi:hypothetical protein